MALLPASHVDLLDRPLPAVLTTEMPDGRLQSTVVWCNRDGDAVLVNTMREFQKARNLHARPRATMLVVEPGDSTRWIEVRGDVDLVDDGAAAHLDRLTRRYTGEPHYYGAIYPVEQQAHETRVIGRVHPRHIVCDAIHRSPPRQRDQPARATRASLP